LRSTLGRAGTRKGGDLYPYPPYDFHGSPAFLVGAPSPAPSPQHDKWAARVGTALAIGAGVFVAGMTAAYFIKNKKARRKVSRVAKKVLGGEAMKQGRLVARHAGDLAGELAKGYLSRAVGRRPPPRKMKLEVLRSTPL